MNRSRRQFLGQLLAAGGLAGLAPRAAFAAPGAGMIQRVGRPLDLETPVSAFSSWATPTEQFFVRSHFDAAVVDEAAWTLTVDGSVRRPLTVGLAALGRYSEVTLAAVLQCAGNGRAFFQPKVPGVQWEKGAMGNAEWTGVRLADVLEDAGVSLADGHVVLAGADSPMLPATPRFERSLPLAKAMHPDTLLAYRMNGRPLQVDHGFPLRAVVPGWAGDIWLKWLVSVRVQPDEAQGFFMQTGYRIPREPVPPGTDIPAAQKVPVTVMPVKSLIASPRTGVRLENGPCEVRGVAFSGEAPLAAVDVSTDGGETWRPAELFGRADRWAWRQWRYAWRPEKPGSYVVLSRATDAAGKVQPPHGVWNPSGYFWNAVDSVALEVIA